MTNIYPKENSVDGSEYHILSHTLEKVISRLDALLFVTKSCKGTSCVEPWKSLHPSGRVSTLREALDPIYDHFYTSIQQSVSFDRCEAGYIIDAEGPQYDPLVSWNSDQAS